VNLNPQELHSSYRDWWCQFDPNTVALLDAINRSGCYVPRFFVAPSGGNLPQNAQAPGAYVPFVLTVPPGSFIFGIYMNGLGQDFVFQVTDLGLSYSWFNTPVPWRFFRENNGSQGIQAPYLFPAPYPVMEPGTFKFEFWSTADPAGSSQVMSVTVGAAVPIESA
jgi:hypothetical protein